jgi:hypothetical protein
MFADRVVERLNVLASALAELGRLRSAYWMCRPMPRSGQSICSTMPALVTVSYSWRMASAMAWR